MKKIFLVAFLLAGYLQMNAQSFTVNNTTSCSITFSIVISDPNTCNAVYTSQAVTLDAGTSVTYNSANDLSWQPPNMAPSSAHWSGIVIILDDGQLRVAGEECASFPASTNFTLSSGTPATADYSINEDWDNIVIIWPSGA